jgi:hypothetical protein
LWCNGRGGERQERQEAAKSSHSLIFVLAPL